MMKFVKLTFLKVLIMGVFSARYADNRHEMHLGSWHFQANSFSFYFYWEK